MKPAFTEQQGHFNAIAGDYERLLGGGTLHDYYQKMGSDYVIAALRRRFPDLQKLRGLELGSGIGDTTVYFDDLTKETHGVDFAREMVHAARERHNRNRFVEAWFHKLPFPDASFDFVFSFGTFHHLLEVDAYRAALKETRRVLRPGGMVLISDTNPWNPLTKLIARVQSIDIGNEHFFSRREAVPLYRVAGFHDIRVIDYGYIPHFLKALAALDGLFSRLKVVIGRYQLITGVKSAGTSPRDAEAGRG